MLQEMGFACGRLNLEFISLLGSVPSILRSFVQTRVQTVFFLWPVRVKLVVDLTEVAGEQQDHSSGACYTFNSSSAVGFAIVCHINCVSLSKVQ